MVQRLSYRRQNSYATRSNGVRIVKTPGGKLAYIHTTKRAGTVKCGDCGHALNGVQRGGSVSWRMLTFPLFSLSFCAL
jgi:large subunit ribosomal protein L34e